MSLLKKVDPKRLKEIEEDMAELDATAKKQPKLATDKKPSKMGPCPNCNGTGLDGDVLCKNCEGSGNVLLDAD